jgi:hypothetical protein
VVDEAAAKTERMLRILENCILMGGLGLILVNEDDGLKKCGRLLSEICLWIDECCSGDEQAK